MQFSNFGLQTDGVTNIAGKMMTNKSPYLPAIITAYNLKDQLMIGMAYSREI